jgi:hypothetical protein
VFEAGARMGSAGKDDEDAGAGRGGHAGMLASGRRRRTFLHSERRISRGGAEGAEERAGNYEMREGARNPEGI